MFGKVVDGRSLIQDGPTPCMPVFEDRPEPVRREPRWLTKADLLKRFGWGEAQYEAAQGHKFPIASKRSRPGSWVVTLVWKDDAIDQWVSDIRAKIAELTALVGRE